MAFSAIAALNLEVDTVREGDFALKHVCPGCVREFKVGDQAMGMFVPKDVIRVFIHTRCLEEAIHGEAPPEEVEKATTSLLRMLA